MEPSDERKPTVEELQKCLADDTPLRIVGLPNGSITAMTIDELKDDRDRLAEQLAETQAALDLLAALKVTKDLVSSYNACLPFADPERDVPKIYESLRALTEAIQEWREGGMPHLGRLAIVHDNAVETLALVQPSGEKGDCGFTHGTDDPRD